MFCYKENRFVSQTHGKREDAGAQWIDTHPAGISAQLEFSCTLIRCGFSVCRREERISLFAMAAEQLSVSERLAMLLHDMRGDDSRYLDETSDPAPQRHGSYRAVRAKIVSGLRFRITAGCSWKARRPLRNSCVCLRKRAGMCANGKTSSCWKS